MLMGTLYLLHAAICVFLILVVLLQRGKGADLSVFGGGSTQAAFGARSATNLLHRLTVGFFVAFILSTLVIAFLQGGSRSSSVITDDAPVEATADEGTDSGDPPAEGEAATPAESDAPAGETGGDAGAVEGDASAGDAVQESAVEPAPESSGS